MRADRCEVLAFSVLFSVPCWPFFFSLCLEQQKATTLNSTSIILLDLQNHDTNKTSFLYNSHGLQHSVIMSDNGLKHFFHNIMPSVLHHLGLPVHHADSLHSNKPQHPGHDELGMAEG